MKRRNRLSLHALHVLERAHVDLACPDSHWYGGCLEARDGDYGAFGGFGRERRASLQARRHEICTALHLFDDYERGVEKRDDLRVMPERVHWLGSVSECSLEGSLVDWTDL